MSSPSRRLECYSPALSISPTPPDPIDLEGMPPEERELLIQLFAIQHMATIGAQEALFSLNEIANRLIDMPSEEVPELLEILKRIQNMMNQKDPLPYDEALSSNLSNAVHILLTRYQTPQR